MCASRKRLFTSVFSAQLECVASAATEASDACLRNDMLDDFSVQHPKRQAAFLDEISAAIRSLEALRKSAAVRAQPRTNTVFLMQLPVEVYARVFRVGVVDGRYCAERTSPFCAELRAFALTCKRAYALAAGLRLRTKLVIAPCARSGGPRLDDRLQLTAARAAQNNTYTTAMHARVELAAVVHAAYKRERAVQGRGGVWLAYDCAKESEKHMTTGEAMRAELKALCARPWRLQYTSVAEVRVDLAQLGRITAPMWKSLAFFVGDVLPQALPAFARLTVRFGRKTPMHACAKLWLPQRITLCAEQQAYGRVELPSHMIALAPHGTVDASASGAPEWTLTLAAVLKAAALSAVTLNYRQYAALSEKLKEDAMRTGTLDAHPVARLRVHVMFAGQNPEIYKGLAACIHADAITFHFVDVVCPGPLDLWAYAVARFAHRHAEACLYTEHPFHRAPASLSFDFGNARLTQRLLAVLADCTRCGKALKVTQHDAAGGRTVVVCEVRPKEEDDTAKKNAPAESAAQTKEQ